jgi:hypothetical protein
LNPSIKGKVKNLRIFLLAELGFRPLFFSIFYTSSPPEGRGEVYPRVSNSVNLCFSLKFLFVARINICPEKEIKMVGNKSMAFTYPEKGGRVPSTAFLKSIPILGASESVSFLYMPFQPLSDIV